MIDIAEQVIPDLSVKSVGSLQVRPGGSNETKLRAGATDNIQLAASWTPTEDFVHVKEVSLLLKKSGTITSGKKLTLQMRSDSSGLPSSTAIGTSAQVETDNIPTSAGWVKFTFTTHVQGLAGITYHFVLTGDYDVSGTNCIVWISNTVASGGNQEIKDSSWAAVATENFNIDARVWNLPALGIAEPILYGYSELCTNPDFETNTTGWTSDGNHTGTRITSDFHSGAACCEIVATGAGQLFVNELRMSFTRSFTKTEVIFEVWAKTVSGDTSMTMRVDGAGANASQTVTITSSWTKYLLTATLAAGSGTFRIMFWLAAAGTFRIDDVSVRESDEYPAVFDAPGSTITIGETEVQSDQPSVEIRTADIATPATNTVVKARGVTYYVFEVIPDSNGTQRLMLSQDQVPS
jgi:hypothetical protein